MKKTNLFTKHPNDVGLSYWKHLLFALMLARKTFGAALASSIHAFFPFMFETYTSRTINELHGICTSRPKTEEESKTLIGKEEQFVAQ